jgi:hypothetical protein
MYRQCAGRAGRRGFDLVCPYSIRPILGLSLITARKSCILWSSGSPGQAARNVKAPAADWPLPPDPHPESSAYESPFRIEPLANRP